MSGQAVQQQVKVQQISKIAGDVYQIILEATGEEPLRWAAGQYLELMMPEGSPCAYSIASAATDGRTLELHIQCVPGHERAREVIIHLESAETVTVRLPNGDCHLGECPDAPLVLIAAGTGFAQMKAMVEHSFLTEHKHPVHLYWGARQPSGFYMPSLPIYWASEKGVNYHPVVSEPDVAGDWNGRHGLLYKAVLDDKEQLKGAHFYISGSPDMVYATVDALVEAGFPEESFHSDVFAYCPRK
ncbi:CDP-6-deoxy-delta-3,4-glucoseen reductase [Sansalvadorimonas verongulae]|uniref:CDP-6-deoxy-delta-3,4-glucoseen reductase n=1 Tax=Sansalvadorimonas verongulae TaxID=2172824 RepID=UPI0012BD21A7|nr:CDP-6-deoxy-delta-3,4-glucoseen reductase [Sansalvadorimonas verongulae]MTI13236.1 CDP-6-deoxy-delta-3,4-glucoseen reductase [Sansalvadorimonas verongulae]